jgi:hypothetical protein
MRAGEGRGKKESCSSGGVLPEKVENKKTPNRTLRGN